MAKVKIVDPLDLSHEQISRYRWQIIWHLVSLGRSKKSAKDSANRWETSLRKTQMEFIGR